MPWIDWPDDECGICGGGMQVETMCPQDPAAFCDEDRPDFPPPYCYDGDRCRCEDGHTGVVYCDADTPVRFRWREDE